MKTAVIVPNWNGEAYLRECLDSLLDQSAKCTLVMVDNGSKDSSRDILDTYGDKIVTILQDKNYGFTGGVNPGIQFAIENDYEAVALFNNDAVADTDWLKHLIVSMKDGVGITTCNFQSFDKKTIDTTGDIFTTWGLPYPRNRGLPVATLQDQSEQLVFGASGGASLYRMSMLKEIGLLDDDFFAYFEDVDISFRAQLAGYTVVMNPKSLAYHRISATSNKMNGFSTYQSIKNWPFVIIKNVPKRYLGMILPRFALAYVLFIGKSATRGHFLFALKGLFASIRLWPKKLRQRKAIQASKKVSDEYILGIMTHDLPENATNLRKLRSLYGKVVGKKV